MDYDDPKIEERWCEERRSDIAACLHRQGEEHGQIGEWPAWHIAPYVSIWAIESKANPSWVGWWAISGDLPTDYLSADSVKHPRDAMQAFASRWQDTARLMSLGQPSTEISIGAPSEWPILAPLLSSRAQLLQDWVADSELWDDL